MNKQVLMNPYVILNSVNYVEIVKTNKDSVIILSLQQDSQIF